MLNKKRKMVIITTVTVGLAISLAIFGGLKSQEENKVWQVQLEQKGDSKFPEYSKENMEYVSIGAGNITGDYDPRTASATGDIAVSQMVFEPLVSVARDGSPRMVLASGLKIEEEGKRYTFTLKRNIKFSDKTPLDAEMIKANYLDAFPDSFGTKDAIQAKGNQISFQFDEADAEHIWMFRLGIQPAKQLNAEVDKKEYIGSGPYKIASDREVDLSAVELVTNEHYHGSKAKSEKVRVVNSDLASLSEMLRTGDIDIIGFGYDETGIQAAKENSYVSLYSTPGNRSGYIGTNLRKEALSEQKVRQGLAHAINYDRIIEKQHQGYADVNPSPFSQVSWATPKNLSPYSYDVDKAIKLFAEAGYQIDKDGRMNKASKPLSFTLATYNGTHAQSVCMLVKEDLKAIGIEVEVVQMEYSELMQTVYQKQDFDLYYASWQYGVSDDLVSRFGEPGADVNPEGWYPEEVQALITKAKGETDWKRRAQIYQELAVLYHEQVPQIPIDTPRSFIAVSGGMKKMKFSPYVSPFWNLETLTSRKK